MTRALLVLLLTLINVSLAAAPRTRAVRHPAETPAAIVEAARQAAEAAMQAGVPGVQVAVARHGRIIYSGAFGVADKDNATALTSRTVMQIASVTKQFTAAAILRLAERGELSLDDRIDKYVPEFKSQGSTVTLRQIMSHTSGLRRDWTPPPPSGVSLWMPVTRVQTIQYLNVKPFDTAPGTNWSYSNAGFMLLGYAIESITGMPYAEFIQNEFALPLGLIDTGLCGSGHLPLPRGYGLVVGGWKLLLPLHPTVVASSGGLCSTASDLARWSHLIAKGYGMLPASYAAMTTPARLANNTVVANGYAFGVHVQAFKGHPLVWHSGAIDGYQSWLLYLSEQDLTVAVITNAFPAPQAGSPKLIADAVANAALATQ
jgi:CubicO group peptidase (beta-lactamase class C family)